MRSHTWSGFAVMGMAAVGELALISLPGSAGAAPRSQIDLGLCPAVQKALDPNGDGNLDEGDNAAALAAASSCSDPAEAQANKAYVLRRMKRGPEASQAISAALAINPNSASVRRFSCMILLDNGELAAAQIACDRAIALRPKWPSAYITRSGIGRQRKDFISALSDVDRAIALGMTDPDTLTLRGEILEAAGRTVEAMSAFNEAIAADPNYVIARNAVGRLLFNDRKDSEAVATFSRSIEIKPTAYAHAWRGRAHYRARRDAEAMADFVKAAELDPVWASPHYYRASLLADTKRPAEAMAAYDKAIALDPKWSAPLVERGKLRQRNGQANAALADFSKAIELSPKWAGAWIARSNLYQEHGRYAESIADARQILAFEPSYAAAWNNVGYGLRETKDYAGAVNAYDRALALDPKIQPSLFWKARTLTEMKRYREAADTYTALLAVNPNYAWARANRGMMRVEIRDHPGAYSDLAWAIDKLPAFTDAWGTLALIGQSAGYSPAETAALIDRASAKAPPGLAGPLFARSILAFSDGDVARSQDFYRQALRLAPENTLLKFWGELRGF
jgi:tetratricopeptide (TPR) repeat protein